MKKVVIYDESCPMCRLYTKGMVAADRSGQLGRLGNHHLTDRVIISRLDEQRARHEIPLVDLDGGETLYGIDTWAYAFGQRSQLITRALTRSWLRAALRSLYAFISYNRRIIVATAPGRWNLFDLTPDFRPGYRLSFAVLTLALTVVAHTLVTGSLDVPFFLFLAGQLLVAGAYIRLHTDSDRLEPFLDYCAHVGLCFLIGGLPKLIGIMTGTDWLLPVGNALIIGQHFIRTQTIPLSPWLSVGFAAGLLLTT